MRILDLARLPALYATRLLAEQGHDVIRIEDPRGDPARRLGPFLTLEPSIETGAYHQFLNAGKRSLALDVTASDCRPALERLIATADVIVASPPLPLDEERIRHLNPTVVLTIVGGDDLPELCAYARAGLLSITGHPGETPVLMGGHIIYAATGLWVMLGTSAAMLVKRTAGLGQTVAVDVQEAFETFLDHAVENFTARGRPTERRGYRGGVTPISGAFPCADGYWMLSLSDSTERWKRFMEWMNDPVLANDESLLDYDARLAKRDIILDRIGSWAMAYPKEYVVTEAQNRHIPAAPVATPVELVADPQLVDRGFLVEVDHPAFGRMRFPRGALATLWDRTIASAPTLGQHTAEILDELGFGVQDRSVLFQRGLIGCKP